MGVAGLATQGTRVSQSLLSQQPLSYIEVSHNPYIVDHNIFASDYALTPVPGSLCQQSDLRKMPERYINGPPITCPTACKWLAMRPSSAMTFYNNVFVGADPRACRNRCYNGYTVSLESIWREPTELDDLPLFSTWSSQPINHNMYLMAVPLTGRGQHCPERVRSQAESHRLLTLLLPGIGSH